MAALRHAYYTRTHLKYAEMPNYTCAESVREASKLKIKNLGGG